MPGYAPARWGTALQDMALTDRVRYHVNVDWENAPDYRTSRTLDWLNDACEAKLKAEDRDRGMVKYKALMSPVSVVFNFRDSSLPFDRNHPLTRKNLAKLRLAKGEHERTFPISLLLTAKRKANARRKIPQIQPYMLLGTKRWLGRAAAVKRYKSADISCDPIQRVMEISDDPVPRTVDRFQCRLHISTVVIDVKFATKFEATFLFHYLKS
jgi:hypothetical protein